MIFAMKQFCPAKAQSLPVRRPVNILGDGGGSLIIDRGNPRWRSAIIPSPLSGPCDREDAGMVGMTVGNLLSANAQDHGHLPAKEGHE
jgi:hypothetical protein